MCLSIDVLDLIVSANSGHLLKLCSFSFLFSWRHFVIHTLYWFPIDYFTHVLKLLKNALNFEMSTKKCVVRQCRDAHEKSSENSQSQISTDRFELYWYLYQNYVIINFPLLETNKVGETLLSKKNNYNSIGKKLGNKSTSRLPFTTQENLDPSVNYLIEIHFWFQKPLHLLVR